MVDKKQIYHKNNQEKNPTRTEDIRIFASFFLVQAGLSCGGGMDEILEFNFREMPNMSLDANFCEDSKSGIRFKIGQTQPEKFFCILDVYHRSRCMCLDNFEPGFK